MVESQVSECHEEDWRVWGGGGGGGNEGGRARWGRGPGARSKVCLVSQNDFFFFSGAGKANIMCGC